MSNLKIEVVNNMNDRSSTFTWANQIATGKHFSSHKLRSCSCTRPGSRTRKGSLAHLEDMSSKVKWKKITTNVLCSWKELLPQDCHSPRWLCIAESRNPVQEQVLLEHTPNTSKHKDVKKENWAWLMCTSTMHHNMLNHSSHLSRDKLYSSPIASREHGENFKVPTVPEP